MRLQGRGWLRRVFLAIFAILLLALVGFVAWAETPYGPDPPAITALADTAQVDVQTDRWLVFQPTQSTPTTGLIIYPGGRVDPRSYAPLAQSIAEQGYLTVIVPMPLNLAVLGTTRADNVIAAFPEMEHWAIAGHSLGGAFAASYAASHLDRVQGLILWAAYPPSSVDLSDSGITTSVIVGSNDGVINQQSLEASRDLLPPNTQWIVIEGGNHAQFGSYGPQPGDNPATISPEDQHRQIVDATVAVLEEIER